MNPEEFKFTKPGEVRTRFAPAPTGFLHIGSVRTALFNYLFAKKNEGSFILRIEDTDFNRSKPEFEADIIENLKWLGIEWSEGPDIGGEYGPYRQRERFEIYNKYLEKLFREEKAYYCFCSEEELESQRQYALSQGRPWYYNGKCAQLSPKEVERYLDEGRPAIVRFKVKPKKVWFNDLIRGKIEFDASLFGDFSIARLAPSENIFRKNYKKNFFIPLYNFACAIDDFEMRISHVIRGEDHLSNTPKQILIQEALDFPQPEYAHLPLILGPDRSKLSKRHEAVAISDYKKDGYLPESLINFIAFLGWNPGGEREIYSMSSLIKEFSPKQVQKGGAIFNLKKLDFLNGFYIRQKSIEKLTELCLPYLIEKGIITPKFKDEESSLIHSSQEISQDYKISESGEEINFDRLKRIIAIYHERLKKLSEIPELIDFFFKDRLEYDKELLRWGEMDNGEIRTSLDKLEKILSEIKEVNWTKEDLEKILIPEAEKFSENLKIGDRGYLLWPLRVALTGKKASAGPFEIAEILGKEKTLKRIRQAKEKLK